MTSSHLPRSAEHRLGAFQRFQQLAETVLGAPVHGKFRPPTLDAHQDHAPVTGWSANRRVRVLRRVLVRADSAVRAPAAAVHGNGLREHAPAASQSSHRPKPLTLGEGEEALHTRLLLHSHLPATRNDCGVLAGLARVRCGEHFRPRNAVPADDHRPTTNRINLVFLAEGYTAGQTAKFTNDARAVLQQLTTTPPFNEYSNYFNAFAVFVASVQAGSDHPASGIFRDTYFNSTYDSYGIQRLVTIPPNDQDGDYANGLGKVDALLQALLPDYDVALLVVNDAEYGGSGGTVLVTSTNPSSPEIGVHEFGHTFADLGR